MQPMQWLDQGPRVWEPTWPGHHPDKAILTNYVHATNLFNVFSEQPNSKQLQ